MHNRYQSRGRRSVIALTMCSVSELYFSHTRVWEFQFFLLLSTKGIPTHAYLSLDSTLEIYIVTKVKTVAADNTPVTPTCSLL